MWRLAQITCSKCIKFNNYLKVFSSKTELKLDALSDYSSRGVHACWPATLCEIMHKYLMKNRRMLTPKRDSPPALGPVPCGLRCLWALSVKRIFNVCNYSEGKGAREECSLPLSLLPSFPLSLFLSVPLPFFLPL